MTAVFAFSYIGRFAYNVFPRCDEFYGGQPSFALELTVVFIYLFEGLSMGVLMLLHLRNFRNGDRFLSAHGREEL